MTCFKGITVMIMVAVCCLALGSLCGYAADTKYTRAELCGIERVYVVVQYLKPEIQTDALTEKQIRSDVRKKLWRVPLIIIPGKKFHKGKMFSPVAILNIKCKVFQMQEGGYGYNIATEVFRYVEIQHDTSEIPSQAVPVWSVKKFGIADKMIDIRQELNSLTDVFISAYRSVNPKRS